MHPDRPPSERVITRQSSQSTVRFRDPDTATLASQIPSTSPTSLPLPARTDHSSTASFANQQFIINSNTAPSLAGPLVSRRNGAFRSSATWTSSSGDLAMFSDTDEIEDRTRFVLEYNRLAKKHGIRVMVMGDFGGSKSKSVPNIMPEQRGWLSRIWHRASVGQSEPQPRNMRHRRSCSDLVGQLMQPKADPPPTQSLQSMVTLGGKSLLYLPPEFAPRALVLPTCFRATAQYLVQHGVVTRGVFRISGSFRVVNALYDYYYQVDADEEITQTIRCPNLPLHIKAGVHDVASAFKRFLGSLPGGILGSLALFDALIAIHSQLRGEPEFNRTRQTKLRARLIAMAIGTIKSQFRRELICAVFGLLSLIGRQAELTPHEDVQGRPLPTSDLMGYAALGIVFGPLLVGHLLDSYTMKVAHPPAGLLLFPLTPTKLKKERAQKVVAGDGTPTVNKIHVANDITEMLITHWREVVRHLDSLGVLTVRSKNTEDMPVARSFPRSPTSDGFFAGGAQLWDIQNLEQATPDYRGSPGFTTPTRHSGARKSTASDARTFKSTASAAAAESEPALSVKRLRPKPPRSASLNRISVRHSLNPLSPTAEESLASDEMPRSVTPTVPFGATSHAAPSMDRLWKSMPGRESPDPFTTASTKAPRRSEDQSSCDSGQVRSPGGGVFVVQTFERNNSTQDLQHQSRLDSKLPFQSRILCQSAGSDGGDEDDNEPGARKTPIRSPNARSPTIKSNRKEKSRPPLSAGIVSARLKRLVRSSTSSSEIDGRPRNSTDGQVPVQEQPFASKRGSQRSAATQRQSRQHHSPVGAASRSSVAAFTPVPATRKRSGSTATPMVPPRPLSSKTPSRQDSVRSTIRTTFYAPMEQPQNFPTALENMSPAPHPVLLPSTADVTTDQSSQWVLGTHTVDSSSTITGLPASKLSESEVVATPSGQASASPPDPDLDDAAVRTRVASMASIASSVADAAQRSRGATLKTVSTPIKPKPPSAPIPASQPTLRKSASRPGGVKAMAAMWEGAAQDSPLASATVKSKRKLTGTKSGDLVSPYRSNEVLANPVSGGPGGIVTGANWDLAKDRFSPKRTMRTNGTGEKASKVTASQEKANATVISDVQHVQLKPIEHALKPPSQPPTPLDGDKTLERPPSLGIMVPHQEEPPVDKHINFSRPPSAASTNLIAPDGCELPEGALPVPTPSPAQGGGNCLLHAQIRSLQKLLSVRSEEVASLRRQLETMSNMDIGTLSEQLRDAKRECTMWKGRAEAAEKRVAVFERFTSRIRGIRAAAGPDNDGTGETKDTANGKRLVSVGGESAASVGTTKTEDDDVVVARIRNSLKTMDGTRSLSIASSVSNNGGAGAWWNAAEPRGSRRASTEGMKELDYLDRGGDDIAERARLV